MMIMMMIMIFVPSRGFLLQLAARIESRDSPTCWPACLCRNHSNRTRGSRVLGSREPVHCCRCQGWTARGFVVFICSSEKLCSCWWLFAKARELAQPELAECASWAQRPISRSELTIEKEREKSCPSPSLFREKSMLAAGQEAGRLS